MTRKLPVRGFLRCFPIFLVVVLFAGCTRTAGESLNMPQFVPPTLVPTSTPTIEPVTGAQVNTSEGSGISGEAVECLDDLSFISDTTIPDDTVIAPGSSLDKRWEVKNSGTCNWDEGYQLRMISGDAMGAEIVQPLPPVRSGAQSTIRIQFTAPTTAGTYRADWQAYNPLGEPFGDSFYLQIVVEN